MSNIKQDLMKKIEAIVARKKVFAKQASRQKTVANWVADFFTEHDKTKKIDGRHEYHTFASLVLDRLSTQLRTLDKRCIVDFRDIETNNPIIEIRWSPAFVKANNCEEVLIFDASSAYFQSAIEDV